VDGTRSANGDITIIGDLDYIILAEDLDTITITGSILSTGGLNAYDIGAITVGLAGVIDSGNVDGSILSAIDDEQDFTGAIGAIIIYGNVGADATITAEGNLTSLTVGQTDFDFGAFDQIVGNFAGTLVVGGNSGAISIENDITGDMAVTGNTTSITSDYGDISGLIMVGGDLPTVTATQGDVSSDIFVGGTDGSGAFAVTGLSVTGNLVIGAIGGVDTVTMNIKNDILDADPQTYTVTNTNNAAMLVEVAAGAVDADSATIDRITLFEDSANVAVAADNNNIDVDEIFVLENAAAALNVDVEGELGTIVAADDNVLALSSAALQTAFLTANSTETYDVVSDNDPTLLDIELNDDNDIALTLTGTIEGGLTGGVIASGALSVTLSNLDEVGYMVSLNSTVDVNIDTNDSIGSIAASDDINGTLETEGTVAIDDGSAMQAGVDLYGLSGLPAWFAGGVMSEIGDIDIDVTADGDQILIAGIPIGQGYAMGTIYAMLGDVEGSLTLGGSFGGVVAPLDIDMTDITLNMPNTSQVDMLVAPRALDSGPAGNNPSAQLELLNGEILVTETNPYVSGYDSVTVVGSGTLVYVDSSDIVVLTGLNDAAAEVNIEGDIDDLVVETDWAGVVTVSENADGDRGEIGWLTVNGDIDATTADLVAFNFGGVTHKGDITGTSPVDAQQFVIDGTLDSDNKSISWTNLAGDAQTLYVNASRSMEVNYDTFFGKLTNVEITGKGTAEIVSVHGTYDADNSSDDLRTLKNIAKQASKAGLDIFDNTGSAHVGSISTNSAWGKANLRNVVVDGYNEYLEADGKVNGLVITGDADMIEVSRAINNAFINVHEDVSWIQSDVMTNVTIFGDVDWFDAIRANNVWITGDVDSQMSGQNWNKVAVDGTVEELWMFAGTGTGRLSNSRFGYINHENIDNRKWVETAESVTDDGGAGAVGAGVLRNINPYYNPVKVVRSITPGLNVYSSLEHPDYTDDLFEVTPDTE
jgi:hypothetical protein